jgi:CheY-like chemotaxis protein
VIPSAVESFAAGEGSMQSRKHWNILIVDDEPDVHDATRLSLKRERIFGVPVKSHHANSAREAKELLAANRILAQDLALALIDVVMETDHAGLDLCNHIRNDLQLHAIQLVLRTGQPGQAPPRKIIDDYDISSYLTKVEASGDRLYLAVKSSVQQFFHARTAGSFPWLLDELRSSDAPAEALINRFNALNDRFVGDWSMLNVGIEAEGKYIGLGCFQDRAEFERVSREVLPAAKAQFEQRTLANGVPNPIAQVGEYLVLQAKIMRSGHTATMIAYQAVVPERSFAVFGPLYRLYIGYIGELFA